MVTLCDIGININFYINNKKINISNVAESINEMDNISLDKISFKEYENVEIEFLSNNFNDKLYIDGIDLLPSEFCEVDNDGDLYLKVNNQGERYPLFMNSNEYYAMRIGNFEIKIIHNEATFLQWYSVIPKNVSANEWEIMQTEIEDELRGLSTDIIRKNIALGEQFTEIAPSEELYKFFVIKRHFSNILAALIDLKDKANYRIKKQYALEPLYMATCIDNITVKDYLKRGTGEEKYLVPKRMYNYDLPENRWLKKIINIYEKELCAFQNVTLKYINYIESEIEELNKYKGANSAIVKAKENVLIELKEYIDVSKKILNISQLIKSQEWYKQVSKVDSIVIPHVLIYDVRYSAFYKMYKEMLKEYVTVKWSDKYSYSWKLSSKMYEIWCFVKICRFLISEQVGFNASGWLFDEYKNEQILVPELKPETIIIFTKNQFKIKLYYDATLGKTRNSSDKDNRPVFSKNKHIRPDIRMDLYKGDIYWSSLIFEVKYREIRNFWNAKESSCKEQVRAYKNDISSQYCRGLSPDYSIRKVRPVDRVWVINPTRAEAGIIDKKDEGIKLVQLIPGGEYDLIIDELKEEINLAFDETFSL